MRVSRSALFHGRHFRDEIIVLCLRWLYRAIDSAGNTIDFLPLPKRDLTAAKAFLQSATLQVDGRRPRVINVDGHPGYPGAIEELKRSGELGRNCQFRPN